LREEVSKKDKASAWALSTEFMMSQKKNFRTHQGKDQESLLVSKAKEKYGCRHI
jgi:hypothetical protein